MNKDRELLCELFDAAKNLVECNSDDMIRIDHYQDVLDSKINVVKAYFATLEYSEKELSCKGCLGPCGRCEGADITDAELRDKLVAYVDVFYDRYNTIRRANDRATHIRSCMDLARRANCSGWETRRDIPAVVSSAQKYVTEGNLVLTDNKFSLAPALRNEARKILGL